MERDLFSNFSKRKNKTIVHNYRTCVPLEYCWQMEEYNKALEI